MVNRATSNVSILQNTNWLVTHNPILLEAEKNRDLILKATTEFRNFIKEEFKFKELF